MLKIIIEIDIKVSFQDQKKSASDEDTKRNAEKIIAFLGRHPEGCTTTDISRGCFRKNLSTEKTQKALNYLLFDTPPRIYRTEVVNNKTGRNPILYKIVANYAN